MATLKIFSSKLVVICFLCTSETLLCGCRIKTFIFFLPLKAFMAAEPVSPDVAPNMVN